MPLRIHAPEADGRYAVVVFQHAFLSSNGAYDEILRHLAGHGFVVVVPQMYHPGLAVLLGNPTAAEEAVVAAQVLDWLADHLGTLTGVQVSLDHLGLAGHSRGGKVAWAILENDPARARAVAGLDPVDGTGGPLGNQSRVVTGTFAIDIPSLVLGTALGGACAPEGDNHEQFYAASPPPAWHVIALEHGHADMMDEDAALLAASFCRGGGDRDSMRRLTAGLLVAFFRATLQGDLAAFALIDPTAAPAPIFVDVK